MVQDIIGADSPVLAGITGAIPNAAPTPTKRQYAKPGSSQKNACYQRRSAGTAEGELEIEKIKKEKENQDLYNFILNNKLLQLQSEGKVTITSVDE
ncbi:hypothetical protein DPX16_23242 [Anabarilius grahami]|uniref:Uncharacterized protein n=1 Tax=Anabarilius grahami TaxID=495550 RepID=A0A3N0Z477_ANAGA|nr:hypothetical protein DPX16_23242 [Anabarilius grahami]